MTEVRTLNRDLAKQQPQRVFDSPLGEVLLTKGEKLAALERWQLSIVGEVEPSNEGMTTWTAHGSRRD